MTPEELIAELQGPSLDITVKMPNGDDFGICAGLSARDLAAFASGELSEADFITRYVVPIVSNLRRLALKS